jgi:hypothetical protein
MSKEKIDSTPLEKEGLERLVNKTKSSLKWSYVGATVNGVAIVTCGLNAAVQMSLDNPMWAAINLGVSLANAGCLIYQGTRIIDEYNQIKAMDEYLKIKE